VCLQAAHGGALVNTGQNKDIIIRISVDRP
jgi:hypothetical protein